jgi:multidrug efflux pump subunit AcrB
MPKVAKFFIEWPRAANLILLLIIIAGVASAFNMRRQGYPSVRMDIMVIQTEYPGASPEDVEINVTELIEDELREVDDIEEIKSLSMENYSIVSAYIDPDATNSDRVKRDIRDAVDSVTDFPRQVDKRPEIDEIRSTNVPIMEIALTGDVPEKLLRTYARALENKLKLAKGVGVIEKVGYRKREVRIEADPKKLEDRHVSLGEIMLSIDARNVRLTGGTLESYLAEKKIVTFAEYDNPLDVKDVIIRSTFTGQRIRISDVARVSEDYEDYRVIPRGNGERCISLVIRPREKADIITMSEDVQRIIGQFKKNLPPEVNIKVMFDDSEYADTLLNMVRNNGLLGFALVILVLLLFLDMRTAFWTAAGIPISICGAFILFSPFGLTINFLTLSAMVLVMGILVDDAIVVAENIYFFKEKGMPPSEAAIKGVRTIFWPVVGAVSTTMMAFAPMLIMSGMIGKFVIGIPLVVILMLGMSLIESTCFLPTHIAHTKPPKLDTWRQHWTAKLKNWYRKRLGWILANKKKALFIYVAVFVAVIVISKFALVFILFKDENPDAFWIVMETPQGTPIEQTEKKISEVEDIVMEVVPENLRKGIISRVGNHDTDIYGGTVGNYDNYGLITMRLKLAKDRDVRSEAMMDELRERFDDLEGFQKLNVIPYYDGPPVGKPVTVIYSTTDDELRKKFEQETMEYLKTIDGVYGIESNNVPGKVELRLKIDYTELAKLGLTAKDVARTVRAAFDGEVVTSIRREGEEIDFRVSLVDPEFLRAEDVLDVQIPNVAGHLVPLGSFANFEETTEPAVIPHHNAQRSVSVTAEIELDKVTSGKVNSMVEERFGAEAAKHAGFIMELGGEEKRTEESMRSFYFALGVALLAIYFILVLLFNSFTQPFLIMSVIPFAFVGVLITFMIHGLPLGFIALIGLLGLIGVVVNDSIVMLSTLNKMCRDAGDFSCKCIIAAATTRLRPVILTTVTTVAGLIPTAYGILGKLQFIEPMVLAMAWGLVFGTFVTLGLVPLLYSMFVRAKA